MDDVVPLDDDVHAPTGVRKAKARAAAGIAHRQPAWRSLAVLDPQPQQQQEQSPQRLASDKQAARTTNSQQLCNWTNKIAPTPVSLVARHAKRKSFHADRVVLSDTKHRTIWISVFALQLSNAALLGLAARAYGNASDRESYLWFIQNSFLFSDATRFLQAYTTWVAWASLLLSAVFLYWSVQMVYFSYRAKALRFATSATETVSDQPLTTTPVQRLTSSIEQPAAAMSAQPAARLTRAAANVSMSSSRIHYVASSLWYRMLNSLAHWVDVLPPRWSTWCSEGFAAAQRLKQSLSIEGVHYDLRIAAENVFELSCQSYAALRSSQRISNIYVGPTYGALIFCNCAAGPFFQCWFRRDIVTRRLARSLCDLLLVSVWGSILPLWLLLPSLRVYWHDELRAAALDNPENTTREVELVLIVSLANVVTIFAPFVSSILNLAELKTVLAITDQTYICKRRIAVVPDSAAQHTSSSLSSSLAGWQHRAVNGASRRVRDAIEQPWTKRVLTAWYAIAMCYGIVMLSVSLHSSMTVHEIVVGGDSALACVHQVYPWFSAKHACIGRKVNCEALNMSGKKQALAALISTFEESSLANLQLSHCTHLEIPSSVFTAFPSLLTLVVRNSSLREWSREAALDASSTLQTVRLINVDMQTFPDGLVSKPLSRTLEWIELRNVDASGFVDAVQDHWQHLKYFDCDGCSLTAVPAMVQTMRELLILALRDNDIDTIADDALSLVDTAAVAPTLYAIYLDGNTLLAHLPPQLWQLAAQCSDFSIQHTNIDVVSDDVEALQAAASSVVIYGFDSPLCRSSELGVALPQLNCDEVSY